MHSRETAEGRLTNISKTDISIGVIAGPFYPFPNTIDGIGTHHTTCFLVKHSVDQVKIIYVKVQGTESMFPLKNHSFAKHESRSILNVTAFVNPHHEQNQ